MINPNPIPNLDFGFTQEGGILPLFHGRLPQATAQQAAAADDDAEPVYVQTAHDKRPLLTAYLAHVLSFLRPGQPTYADFLALLPKKGDAHALIKTFQEMKMKTFQEMLAPSTPGIVTDVIAKLKLPSEIAGLIQLNIRSYEVNMVKLLRENSRYLEASQQALETGSVQPYTGIIQFLVGQSYTLAFYSRQITVLIQALAVTGVTIPDAEMQRLKGLESFAQKQSERIGQQTQSLADTMLQDLERVVLTKLQTCQDEMSSAGEALQAAISAGNTCLEQMNARSADDEIADLESQLVGHQQEMDVQAKRVAGNIESMRHFIEQLKHLQDKLAEGMTAENREVVMPEIQRLRQAMAQWSDALAQQSDHIRGMKVTETLQGFTQRSTEIHARRETERAVSSYKELAAETLMQLSVQRTEELERRSAVLEARARGLEAQREAREVQSARQRLNEAVVNIKLRVDRGDIKKAAQLKEHVQAAMQGLRSELQGTLAAKRLQELSDYLGDEGKLPERLNLTRRRKGAGEDLGKVNKILADVTWDALHQSGVRPPVEVAEEADVAATAPAVEEALPPQLPSDITVDSLAELGTFIDEARPWIARIKQDLEDAKAKYLTSEFSAFQAEVAAFTENFKFEAWQKTAAILRQQIVATEAMLQRTDLPPAVKLLVTRCARGLGQVNQEMQHCDEMSAEIVSVVKENCERILVEFERVRAEIDGVFDALPTLVGHDDPGLFAQYSTLMATAYNLYEKLHERLSDIESDLPLASKEAVAAFDAWKGEILQRANQNSAHLGLPQERSLALSLEAYSRSQAYLEERKVSSYKLRYFHRDERTAFVRELQKAFMAYAQDPDQNAVQLKDKLREAMKFSPRRDYEKSLQCLAIDYAMKLKDQPGFEGVLDGIDLKRYNAVHEAHVQRQAPRM